MAVLAARLPLEILAGRLPHLTFGTRAADNV